MTVESTVVRSPYPGLRPFQSHEAPIFFGRETHVDRLLKILVRERFLAVIGPSGCGKSSLVRAGMLPAVRAGWAGTPTEWRVAIMHPGDHPMRSLARALIDPVVLGTELGFVDGSDPALPLVPLIESELARGPSSLQSIVAAARTNQGEGQPSDLLLLVDQFEEIFRYSVEDGRQADEADAFVKLLLESARDDRTGIRVAITMRSDFLGHCVRFLELPDAINRGQYLTPRLDRSQLTSAILEPARVFGGAVDASLATELVNAMGADQDQLPILQDALAQMWDRAVRRDAATPRVTFADLNAIDGITGALGRRADSLFKDLSPSDQRVAEVLFRAITERSIGNGSARDIRRPQTLRDVARISGLDWQVFVPVVESFAADGVNFLVSSTPIGADTLVDISHEALIRQWERLRHWVDEEDRQARELALWRQRSMAHATGGELLSGNDLMRAVEWRDGLKATIHLSVPSNDGLQVLVRSAAAWAARYAVAAGPGSSFEEIRAFIADSEEKQQTEIDARNRAEQQRLEAQKAAAEAKAETERARAEAAKREKELAEHLVGRLERQRKLAWTIAVIAIAASVFAFISFRKATEATEETVKAVDRAIKAIRDAHVAARQAADERVEKVLAKADLQRAQAELAKEQQAAKEHVYQASHELPATVVVTTTAAVTSTTAATTTAASTTSVTPLPTSTVGSSGHLLDDGALAALAPGLSVDKRTAILSAILPAMREFEIDTPLRQAAFVAQMAHESGGFRFTEESFNYTADRLKAVWPTKFGDSDRAKNYAHQPQKIANYVYADKFGNGPEASGDGWRYRGRGPMLITGRGSYQRFGAVLGVDLEKEPDRAAEWSIGFRIAGVLWTTKKANGFADQGDLQSITRALNGGLIGQSDRIEWYVRTKKALGIE